NLIAGSMIGSTRKMAPSSKFEILMPDGKTSLRGTEYVIDANGAVSVLSGAVIVNYNLPGGGGDIRVTIPAGYSFNPDTGTVVPTTAAFLQNIVQDINTVRQNAETFHVAGATIVVNPTEEVVSQTHGNNGVGNGVDPQPPGNPPVND